MKFKTPNCPECGETAEVIMERLVVWAGIRREGDTFEYAGEADVVWDSQVPAKDNNRYTIGCCNGHEWTTESGEE